jgi:hypothetical protein
MKPVVFVSIGGPYIGIEHNGNNKKIHRNGILIKKILIILPGYSF